jgi:hypothetical protein
MKRRTLLISLGATALLSACGRAASAAPAIKVYKSATCGCCGSWVKDMKAHGFKMETITVSDMNPIKKQFGVPASLQSCHTSLVDDYVIEGHVPADMLRRVLDDRPQFDVIALPGMPAGSPGMNGEKRGLWKFYGVKDGRISLYARM